MKKNYTIVSIDDDPLVNQSIKVALSTTYSNVVSFTNPDEALEKMHLINPDLLLLDIYLGHRNGLEVLEQLQKDGWTMPVLMITAMNEIKLALRAGQLGAEDYIVKPVDLNYLEFKIEQCLNNVTTRKQVEIFREKIQAEKPSEMIGDSEGMKRAINIAGVISKAETTVLITGESGTGKELMAQYIYENSPRAKGPFIAINCGAIPRELAENELFGYEKGAFTGATEKVKQGKFEQAQHGTIFLDEIGELNLDLQVKLLRVLDNRSFFRLGGSKEIAIDVRVIAATNKNLIEEVESGNFRRDLYHRLNIAEITLPPLRDRGDDILTLATVFVNEFNNKFGRNLKGFAPDAANILTVYSWKGNIRELRNVIERVVLLHEAGEVIKGNELDFMKSTSVVQVDGKNTNIEIKDKGHFLQISKNGTKMEDVIKDLIVQTLKLTKGNQVKATELLGTTRARLRYRIEQLGIITEKNVE